MCDVAAGYVYDQIIDKIQIVQSLSIRVKFNLEERRAKESKVRQRREKKSIQHHFIV